LVSRLSHLSYWVFGSLGTRRIGIQNHELRIMEAARAFHARAVFANYHVCHSGLDPESR